MYFYESMKLFNVYILRFLIVFFVVSCTSELGSKEKVEIGVVYDGSGTEDYPFFLMLQEEIQELLSDEYVVSFTSFYGNWTAESVSVALKKAEQDASLDALITVGLLASKQALLDEITGIPVIIPYVLSREIQEIFKREDQVLPPNIILLKGEKSLEEDIVSLHKVAPFRSLAIIGDKSVIGDELPVLRDGFRRAFREVGLEVRFIPVTNQINPVIASLKKQPVDAVFFYPTWRLSPQDFKRLVEAVNQMGIPSFSYLGEEEVKQGVLLTTTPKSHLKRVSRRVALNLLEIFNEGLEGDVDREFPNDFDLIVNAKTAKRLGIEFPWQLAGLARIIDKEEENEAEFSYLDALKYALCCNLDILAESYLVSAGWQSILKARSTLLPQILGHAGSRIIDADRARASGGLFPQYRSVTSFVYRQDLYDNERVTDYCVKKKQFRALEYQKATTQVDVLMQTGLAYLQVLKMKAAVQIAYDTLLLTKANYRRALARVQAGEASKAELYRWESEISRNHEDYLHSLNDLENMGLEFNRILNRPLETKVRLAELKSIEEASSEFFLPNVSLNDYLDDENRFFALKEFFCAMANTYSPELKELDEKIEERRCIYQGAKRAYYMPKVTVHGEVGRVYRGGAGKRYITGVPVDDVEMLLNLEASLPLYTSGGLDAEKRRACYELRKLQTERLAVKERIERTVLSVADTVRTEYRSIALAKKTAEAAKQNLEIVADSYSRGVVSIVDLIDAQNAFVVAELNYLNSAYDFLEKLVQMQRAIGVFFPLQDAQCLKEWTVNLTQLYGGSL
ncbi:MAG: hypothetical protein Tsb0021_04390 [Chlamydiales bacterium]